MRGAELLRPSSEMRHKGACIGDVALARGRAQAPHRQVLLHSLTYLAHRILPAPRHPDIGRHERGVASVGQLRDQARTATTLRRRSARQLSACRGAAWFKAAFCEVPHDAHLRRAARGRACKLGLLEARLESAREDHSSTLRRRPGACSRQGSTMGRWKLRNGALAQASTPLAKRGVKCPAFWATIFFMSSPVRKILDEVQKLPKQDRALLRAELDELDEESPEDEVEAAWDEGDRSTRREHSRRHCRALHA